MQWLLNRDGAIIQASQAGYGLGSRTIITATGASTYTTPAGCRAILVEAIGGGGGGGQPANSSAAQISLGTGGGAGGHNVSPLIMTAGGRTYAATVGAGGAALNSGNNTTFIQNFNGNTIVQGTGGSGGSSATTTGTAETFNINGSGGGSLNGDFVNSSGGVGFVGYTSPRVGHRVSGTVGFSGVGAPGMRGGQPVGNKATANPANAGGLYGAGGNGSISINAGASVGGAGGNGVIVVWEFY